MTPKRIQRRRTRGWRMSYGAKAVGRPGPFGNPFMVSEDCSAERCVLFFRECLERAMRGEPFPASPRGGALSQAVMQHFQTMARRLPELRGHDLACWCSLFSVCHADVLLELANLMAAT